MKIFLGIAAALLIGTVVWTIITIFRHPNTNPMADTPATATAIAQATPTPTPSLDPPLVRATPRPASPLANQASQQPTTARSHKNIGASRQETSAVSSGNLTTTITTETIDEWGNHQIESRTEAVSW